MSATAAAPGALPATPNGPEVVFTLFKNVSAAEGHERRKSFREFADWIVNPRKTHASKPSCPLIKMAEFGGQWSERGSLRHDANLLTVTGIEADYDAGVMSLDAAAARLSFAGFACVICTTASHTTARPRWRILAPLSKPHPPADRRRFVARVNGLLGGILAPESFTLSQPFYVGRVEGAPYEAREFHHADCIDQLDALDGIAAFPDDAVQAERSRAERVREVHTDDPVVARLRERGLVLRERPSGGVDFACPFAAEHTGPGGRGDTSYFPPHTGGFKHGHFKCLHGHCATRTDEEFLDALGMGGTPAGPARSAADAERRRQQKLENEEIGEGAVFPLAELVTLEGALQRFVLTTDGSRVSDTHNRHYDVALSDWRNAIAASVELIQLPNGKSRAVPVSSLWLQSEARMTVAARTFKAGGPPTLCDPDGRVAFNSWRAFDRTLVVSDPEAAGLPLFLDHVAFLFPGADDRHRFLDWLAHVEQRPGELPHTAWLHIAQHYGLGRNWLEALLTRLWPGSVAANMDLLAMLRTGFNGRLGGKVLACVDELREGARDGAWEHAEKLKSLLTEEHRLLNPKYGRQTVEYNAVRWLMFSNYESAIPLEKGDRRIEVVSIRSPPRSVDYYSTLYAALDDPLFVAAVAAYLGRRSLAGFKPGRHAASSSAKAAVVQASQSPAAELSADLVECWPSDVIVMSDLSAIMVGMEYDGRLEATHRRSLQQAGVVARRDAVRVKGIVRRVQILRNHARWLAASSGEIAAEAARGMAPAGQAMNHLLEALATRTTPRGQPTEPGICNA